MLIPRSRILRVTTVAGILTTALAGWLVFRPEWIQLREVKLELVPQSGQTFLFEKIKSTLEPELAAYAGRYFWQVNLERIAEIARRDKRVKDVVLEREFPSRVKVRVEPRTPVLAYFTESGRVSPVAADGTLLPPVPAMEAPGLPLLRGREFPKDPALRESAIDMVRRIQAAGGFENRPISEIVYNQKDGFDIYLPGALQVKMGDTDFGPKVSRVQKVLNYLDSRQIEGRVIDARFAKKVVVRVRNTP